MAAAVVFAPVNEIVVIRGEGCQHAEIGDTIFAERATAPITWATIDQPTLFCGACRNHLYPHENGYGDVEVRDEPYGAGM